MKQDQAQPIAFRPRVLPEDVGRANLYALIARLFSEPADSALLRAIASSPPLDTEDSGAELPRAWSSLIAAASAMDADAAREEYEALFGGVGKAEINLHASHHLAGFMMEKPLADLRDHLAELGLARLEQQPMPEDHLSALCEVMRVLIVGTDELPPRSLDEQRRFFEQRLAPWVDRVLFQILNHPLANFYRLGAELTRAFISLEQDALKTD